MQAQDLLRTGMVMNLMTGGMTGWTPVRNFLAISLYELGLRTYPHWSPWVSAFCSRRKRTEEGRANVPLNRTIRASITCERTIPSQGKSGAPANAFVTRMDAIVHYIVNSTAIRHLLSVSQHDYLPYEFEPTPLDNDIFFQLTDLRVDDGQVASMKFKLFCYEHDAQYLQRFVDSCNTDYERRMANKLGSHLYFFDQVVESKKKIRGSVQNPLPQSHLMYTKNKFSTTRTFENVFFEERETVRSRTRFFLDRRDWYEKKGIPYTLGFLFHGDPGCGKTSTIKAIANESRRHIINVQLSEIKTKSQLRHLFFNEEIHVFNGQTTERYTIPIHERLYVFEDFDAMGDVILERRWKKPTVEDVKRKDDPFAEDDEVFKEPIDLAFLLNLIDGTLERRGSMTAFATNFPERIDRALIRPGRIDVIVHFKKCNREILIQMVKSFYDLETVELEAGDLDYKWTPAEVNQIMFRNFDKPDVAIHELLTLRPSDLYGFCPGSENAPETLASENTDVGQTHENR
jgi:hypothetical protein